MLRKVVPFRSWHFEWVGDASEPGDVGLHPTVLAQLERENSWTCIVDGAVVMCAGTVKQWSTRHTSWALLNRELSPPHMRWLTQETRKNLAGVAGRVELTVRADFPQGQKWARLLGFEVETPLLKMFGPEGEDHIGYVRIN